MPALLSAVALLPVACAVGPTPKRPGTGLALDQPYAAATRPTSRPAELGQTGGWWQRFGDDATTQLVERAVSGNVDLRASAARVTQGRALLRQAFASRLPTITGSASRDRRAQSIELPNFAALAGAPADGNVQPSQSVRTNFLTTTFDAGIDVSWQIDLFGGLRRAEQAARLDFLAAAAEQAALYHTVVAETIRARVAVATLQTRLDLARQNLESLQETLRVTENRYRSGVGDPLSLRLARENAASAVAQIPPLESDLAVSEHALSVLIGERPGAAGDLPRTLPPVPTLTPPPLSLPAALLDRRPDLQASELRSRAAQARIGVAVADLFPKLNLAASGGYTASDTGTWFDPESQVYDFLIGLTQPIFEGGRRRAAVAASRALAEAAAADYLGVVLNAVREVEDALVQEDAARRETDASERALVEGQASESLARDRYKQGLASLLDVFEAERRRRAAEERLALARQKVWNARIDLHLALGGDWQLRGTAESADARR